jgi:ribosomal protein S18 acetylase RimI-like enzyme
MEHILDNPVWSALSTENFASGIGNEIAKYYLPEVSPFAAVQDYSPENFQALFDITPARAQLAIITNRHTLAPGPWQILSRIDGYQMIYNRSVHDLAEGLELVKLSMVDVPQMMELTALTKPGPFLSRTIDLGNYEGIFDGSRLVAMGGFRFHSENYIEISAVCTHPDYQGRGYASQLILNQISRIHKDGKHAYLHVRGDNRRAIQIYQKMGFETRTEMMIYTIKKG